MLMGKGLGFQKKVGDAIDAAATEKIFSLQQNAWSQRLSELLAEIPLEVFTTTELVIALAKKRCLTRYTKALPLPCWIIFISPSSATSSASHYLRFLTAKPGCCIRVNIVSPCRR
ncbi:Transcription antiterminator LicT|nr:Transcription antiterminator LicT [Candidatus Pantoea persica]